MHKAINQEELNIHYSQIEKLSTREELWNYLMDETNYKTNEDAALLNPFVAKACNLRATQLGVEALIPGALSDDCVSIAQCETIECINKRMKELEPIITNRYSSMEALMINVYSGALILALQIDDFKSGPEF